MEASPSQQRGCDVIELISLFLALTPLHSGGLFPLTLSTLLSNSRWR